MTDRILFLDDDYNRHSRFRQRTLEMGYNQFYTIVQVESAAQAIDELNKGGVIQAFLDHDLSEEDIMIPVGEPTKVPTGMAVVDHIVQMDNPPAVVVIHSMNPDASMEMGRRLSSTRRIETHRIPFYLLLERLTIVPRNG